LSPAVSTVIFELRTLSVVLLAAEMVSRPSSEASVTQSSGQLTFQSEGVATATVVVPPFWANATLLRERTITSATSSLFLSSQPLEAQRTRTVNSVKHLLIKIGLGIKNEWVRYPVSGEPYLLKIASCEIFGLVYLRHNIRKFARMLSGNPENIVVKVFSYCLFFGVMRVYKVDF
jgi:hypothetical protein